MTRTESQARTRMELLDAAARVFARCGYERASITEIAEKAGYSHGAVYSNFESKQELFLALYEQIVTTHVAEIMTTSTQTHDLAEDVRGHTEEWMRRLAADPLPLLLRLEFTVRAVHDPELQRKLAARAGAIPLAIRDSLERAVATGGGELPLPAADLALGIQALNLGLALEALGDPHAVTGEVAGNLAELLIAARNAPPDRSRRE